MKKHIYAVPLIASLALTGCTQDSNPAIDTDSVGASFESSTSVAAAGDAENGQLTFVRLKVPNMV